MAGGEARKALTLCAMLLAGGSPARECVSAAGVDIESSVMGI
jgi:hypothetical protein